MVFSMCLIIASTACPALSLDSSAVSETASIKSFLLISCVLVAWRRSGPRQELRSSRGQFQPLRGSNGAETTPKAPARQAKIGPFRRLFRRQIGRQRGQLAYRQSAGPKGPARNGFRGNVLPAPRAVYGQCAVILGSLTSLAATAAAVSSSKVIGWGMRCSATFK